MIKTLFITGYLILLSSISFASSFHLMDARDHEQIILTDKVYTFLNHATAHWDKARSSKDGIKNLLAFSSKNNIPVISTFDTNSLTYDQLMNKYFIAPKDVDIAIESWAGQHNIVFKNAKKIFISGGNLSLCLCESIRDIVRGSIGLQDNTHIDLYIVTDAIYDERKEFNPIKKGSLRRFIRSYFSPSFSCPLQNNFEYPLAEIQNTIVKVFEEKSFIVKFNLTPRDFTSFFKPHKSINIRFIRSENLEKYL